MMDTQFGETTSHLETLTLPYLCLEVYIQESLNKNQVSRLTRMIETVWPHVLTLIEENHLYDGLPMNFTGKVLEVELTWTHNDGIQHLNRAYRQKDQPTDVLTFTLLADAPDPALWMSLPVLQLGSMFISVEYGNAATSNLSPQDTERYLLERFIHGMLHLLGMHHDTQEKYEKVVSFQQQVLTRAGL